MLPFIIAGIVSGCAYGLIGVGLTLTYKTSGIFNFAHGALGTLGAYAFYWLYVEQGVPLGFTLVLVIAVLGLVLGLSLERLAAGLASQPLASKVTATVGLLLVIQSGAELIYGPNRKEFPVWLPSGSFSISGTNVTYAQLSTLIIAVSVTVLLYAGLRYTRTGKAMRAVVDNPELLDLMGTNPVFVRRVAWTISYAFVALSALLLAPDVNLDPFILTALVLQGFGAAALGAFRNIPMTFIGGLAIGVLASLLTKWITTPGIWQGLAPSLPFIVLFAVTLLLPKRYLVIDRVARTRNLATPWKPPVAVVCVSMVAVFVALCFVPGLVGYRLGGWTNMLCYVMLLLSLGLLVRNSGQVSLGQITFAAIGVCAFAKLTNDVGVPWALAAVMAGLAVIPIAAVLAVPAIRLSGLYLAVSTFGFGYLVQNMFYNTNLMFGQGGIGITVPAPDLSWLSDDTGRQTYYAILAMTVVATVLVVIITRTRLGRILSAMSDSSVGLNASGVSITVARVLVFCISGFLAGIAGAMLGVVQTTAAVESFPPAMSLTLLALIVIVVGGAPWYALLGAAGIALVPVYLEGEHTTTWLNVFFGVQAIIIAVVGLPHLPEGLREKVDRLGRKRRADAPAAIGDSDTPPDAGAARSPIPEGGALRVEDLTVRFGGLVALNKFDLTAPVGRITGLVGPNGAGKSTMFAAASGLVKPSEGTVELDGRRVTGMSVEHRARLGLGRTFQQMELFDSLTVRENVAMGREAGFAGSNPLRLAITFPGERAVIDAETDNAIRLCGIEHLAEQVVGGLSTGQRRLVELARCLAGDFHLLMLDEPSSGLGRAETEDLGTVLKRVVAERGVGVLLVEHDMSLVMDVCEYINVLDFGTKIFEGTPSEVRASEVVRAAYLGEEDAENTLIDVTEDPSV